MCPGIQSAEVKIKSSTAEITNEALSKFIFLPSFFTSCFMRSVTSGDQGSPVKPPNVKCFLQSLAAQLKKIQILKGSVPLSMLLHSSA